MTSSIDQKATGIIIAAGMGARMGEFTRSQPKCLLPVRGRALLDWTLDNFRKSHCDPVIAIVGHLADTIERPGLLRIRNDDYRNNNILHSMMHAVEHLRGPVLVSYSDIWVEPQVFERLSNSPGEIVLAVDMDWRHYYVGRTDHPLAEAEKAHVDGAGRVVRIGKHISEKPEDGLRCGEFIGLWRMSASGTASWVSCFQDLNASLGPEDPFQNAALWRKAYATDLVQHLIDQGVEVRASTICRGWAELDTAQDYQRLPAIASEQRLQSLINEDAT